MGKKTFDKSALTTTCAEIEEHIPKNVLVMSLVNACMIADLPETDLVKIIKGIVQLSYQQHMLTQLLVVMDAVRPKEEAASKPTDEQLKKAEAAMKEFIEKISTTSKGE